MHTLEITEKIKAILHFQLKPAQAKINVMVSGLSELRLQHSETWNETKPPPQLMPLLTEEADSSICSHRMVCPGQNWDMLTTLVPRTWELGLLLPDSTFLSKYALVFNNLSRSM